LTSDELRKSLVEIARKQENQARASGSVRTSASSAVELQQETMQGVAGERPVIQLSDVGRENLKDLLINHVLGVPQSMSDCFRRWHWDNAIMKSFGIVMSSLLLSLGAPVSYVLLRLPSESTGRDGKPEQELEVSGQASPGVGAESRA
jgi:hypothetical protein